MIKKWLNTHIRIRLPAPKLKDETLQETGLILFFCMFGVGLWWLKPAISFIICGLMGMWFFFPRGR